MRSKSVSHRVSYVSSTTNVSVRRDGNASARRASPEVASSPWQPDIAYDALRDLMAETLKAARAKAGLTEDELAVRIHRPTMTVRKIEGGVRLLRMHEVDAYAASLDRCGDTLVGMIAERMGEEVRRTQLASLKDALAPVEAIP